MDVRMVQRTTNGTMNSSTSVNNVASEPTSISPRRKTSITGPTLRPPITGDKMRLVVVEVTGAEG